MLPTWLVGVLVAAITIFFTLRGLPHLSDALWQDEALALNDYSIRGFLYPFLHYELPNNHVLFSALASVWIESGWGGASLVSLRCLPFLFAVASVPLCFLTARRLGGTWAGLLAALMFAASPVAIAFATQFRGYAPSWLFALAMLYFGLDFFRRPGWAWITPYTISAALLVGLVPANLFIGIAIGLALIMRQLLVRESPCSRPWLGMATLLLAPFLGMAFYGAIWRPLVAASRLNVNDWTRGDLLGNWLDATSTPIIWLAPVLVASLVLGTATLAAGSRKGSPQRGGFLLAILLLAALPAVIFLMPGRPFPRTFAAFLPVWYCAISTILGFGASLIRRRHAGGLLLLLLLAMGLPMIGSRLDASCGRPRSSPEFTNDLCFQYFHDRYFPSQVVHVWSELGQPNLPIVTDFEGYYAIGILGSEARVYEFRSLPAGARRPPLLVGFDQTQMERMARAIAEDPADYAQIADTGYFKVFAPLGRRKPL